MIESAEEFHRLCTSEDPEEQRRAAQSEAPLAVWREAVARYPELREWVAWNKTVPSEVLVELADDSDSRVRWVVASKRKLPPELQLRLAGDPERSVRERIAWNAKATRAALEQLVEDPSPEIAERARGRLKAKEHS